jgi:hypothetical protein
MHVLVQENPYGIHGHVLLAVFHALLFPDLEAVQRRS